MSGSACNLLFFFSLSVFFLPPPLPKDRIQMLLCGHTLQSRLQTCQNNYVRTDPQPMTWCVSSQYKFIMSTYVMSKRL